MNLAGLKAKLDEDPEFRAAYQEETINHLHARFVEISKRKEPVRLVAHLWLKILNSQEYNGDATALERDSRFVAWYLSRQIKAEKRMPGALRLKNLLQEEQFFADRAEAKSLNPKAYAALCKPGTPAASTCRPAATGGVAKPQDESAVRQETAAGLRALREQLGGLSAEEVEKLKSANAQKQLPDR